MKIIAPKRILIMKFRNIGDVLLTTPLIKNLKLNYPDSLIDIAVNKGCEDMVTLNPYINDVIIYNRAKIKKGNLFNRLKDEILFAYKIKSNNYDLVINTTKGDRGAQLAFISGAKTKIGYRSNSKFDKVFDIFLPKQEFRHTLEMDLDSISLLDLKIFDKKVEIFWTEEDLIKIEKILLDNNLEEKKFIHIHPVSRWLFKCVSDDIMAKIIDYFQLELKIKVVLTAAPIEEEMNKLESIIKLCKSNPLNLGGLFTLKQTACLNKKSKIFVGVDTSIMHISAANDIPVLVFFGPSGTDHWGPWDNECMKSGYSKRNGFQIMGKHRVIAENRECQPCGKDGCNGSKISDCLMNLDIDFIKKNIKEMLNI